MQNAKLGSVALFLPLLLRDFLKDPVQTMMKNKQQATKSKPQGLQRCRKRKIENQETFCCHQHAHSTPSLRVRSTKHTLLLFLLTRTTQNRIKSLARVDVMRTLPALLRTHTIGIHTRRQRQGFQTDTDERSALVDRAHRASAAAAWSSETWAWRRGAKVAAWRRDATGAAVVVVHG